MEEKNDLSRYFENNQGNCIDKWMHYFEIYHLWFEKYRNKPVNILEIGVYQGGSLKMWKEYFGKNANIYAIDINPDCKQFEDEQTTIFIGSQEDRNFLKMVGEEIPPLDIIIDDGGHTMRQQIITFEEMYGKVKMDGIYLCEDLHTSYWRNYGGGFREKSSFIEYSKNFIDKINAWNSREDHLKVDDFTMSTFGLHFYPSMIIIEKRAVKKPVSKRNGAFVIPAHEFPVPQIKKSLHRRIISKMRKMFRNILKQD